MTAMQDVAVDSVAVAVVPSADDDAALTAEGAGRKHVLNVCVYRHKYVYKFVDCLHCHSQYIIHGR